MPGARLRISNDGLREGCNELRIAMGVSNISKLVQNLHRGIIEVSVRDGWVRLPFLPEKSLNIPAVLLQQRAGFILRMCLEMNEQALIFRLHEKIHTCPRRFGQHGITT